jgi:hypothetical protein
MSDNHGIAMPSPVAQLKTALTAGRQALRDGAQGVLGHLPLTRLPTAAEQGRARLPVAVQDWLELEQKALCRAVDKTRLMSPEHNAQSNRYKPENARVFRVKTYWVDADKARGFIGKGLTADLEKLFLRDRAGRREYRLLVHPESERFYREVVRGAQPGPDLFATATASSRTLLAWEPGAEQRPFFAKLSLDKKIAGSVRTIPQGEVARSIGISEVLRADRRVDGFDYLPEVFGLMPAGLARGGMLVRPIPEHLRNGSTTVVPLFSLYARPHDGGAPLLAQMLARTGEPPTAFVVDRLIRPFVQQWFEMAVKRGIVDEPHAQNVLLEVDEAGLPSGRFVRRDLGGFNVDFDYRDRLRLKTPEPLPVVTDRASDYFTGEHTKTWENLEIYFVGGFVFNLEQALPTWCEQGLICGPVPEEGALREAVLSSLEESYQALTGSRFELQGSFAKVPALIAASREHWAAARGRFTVLDGQRDAPPGLWK